MASQRRYLAAGALIGFAVCALLWLISAPGALRQAAGFCLLWIWPALTWSTCWRGAVSERLAIGAGAAVMLNTLMALAISYVPGATPGWTILLGALFTTLAPIGLLRPGADPVAAQENSTRPDLYLLLGLVALAVLLRLPGMGYKELQGDEGVVLVRAATILSGDDSEWFNHQKGPMEILLPLVGWGLSGSTNDTWARLPFAWAGILAVLAVYWLGRQWFDGRTGLVAGLLFAIGGFGIAFSRVVQYQSLVMLWSALALLMATRYRRAGKRADLVMACSFLAAGLLAHYDAILAAPALAWLVIGRWRSERRIEVGSLLVALAISGFILALFYLPYVLNPNFARTFNYLVRERVGVSGDSTVLAGGSGDAWRMMTFYNSLWYIVGLIAAVTAGVAALFRRRTGLAAALLFAVPAAFYLVLVRDPRTHVYTIFPGAALLAGAGVVLAWRTIKNRARSPIPQAAAAVGAIWLLVVAAYPVLLFVDTSVERQRTWSENRPWPILYPASWTEPPRFGLFGFPHQAGWRAAASLRPQITLPYGSNEEAEIADWYMGQAGRTYCQNAETFILAANAQDEVPYDPGWLDEALSPWGQITVKGITSMRLYGREPAAAPLQAEATGYDHWLTPGEARRAQYSGQTAAGVDFGEQIRLLGYDLAGAEARPGGRVTLTLYWQASTPIERNYQVFVHLYDGQLWAQHDGAPGCAIWPTTRWEPGQIIADPHLIDLPGDIPAGSMPLVVGLYDLLTDERLPAGGDLSGAFPLTSVAIGDR